MFVWGIWALMLACVLGFIRRYAVNVPLYDDWEIVPALTGNRNVAEHLLEPHNEHIIPLPKSMLLVLYWLTNWDFRAGMVFNALALGTLAAGMIRVTKKLRGWTSYTDAYFPLVLLSPGHLDTFFVSWQVQFVSSAVIAGVFLLIVVNANQRLRMRAGMLAGVCLILLPLCGTTGLAFVPFFALWLGYIALRDLRSGGGGKLGMLLIGFVVLALVFVALYLIHYLKLGLRMPSPAIRDAIAVGLQFLSVSLGVSIGKMASPFSSTAVLLLIIISGGLLVTICRKLPSERTRAAGLLLFLGGISTLAALLGWGRGGDSSDGGFAARYVVLAALVLCWAYFLWSIYATRRGGTFVHVTLFTLACVPLLLDVVKSKAWLEEVREHKKAFLRDMRSGLPLSQLAIRHAGALYNPNEPLGPLAIERFVRRLGQAGHPPYNLVPDDVSAKALAPGVLDDVGHEEIIGWVWDPHRPNESLRVDIFDADKFLATVSADVLREDLRNFSIGDGRHGFRYPIPPTLKDGQGHTVRVLISGTCTELHGSPKQYCSTLP